MITTRVQLWVKSEIASAVAEGIRRTVRPPPKDVLNVLQNERAMLQDHLIIQAGVLCVAARNTTTMGELLAKVLKVEQTLDRMADLKVSA